MPRYLGIDYGEKRVGIAVSDPTKTIAQPFLTIQYNSKKELIGKILNLVEEEDIELIVVGLPLTLKGIDSNKTKTVRKFVENLRTIIQLPIEFVDERFTSIQAQRMLRDMGKKPSEQRSKIDQLAAQSILQTYLDRKNN
jgi:putative Holliday junction resolvase